MSKIKVGIALGGGGALGMAHIGVLKALEENGINPEIIVGTSIGSLIGGVYASGMSVYSMEQEALKIKTIQLLDINLNPTGFLSGIILFARYLYS
jgi:NTE family protein